MENAGVLIEERRTVKKGVFFFLAVPEQGTADSVVSDARRGSKKKQGYTTPRYSLAVLLTSLSGAAIFVVRKSYKTEKAQDIVVLCFFVVYIC